MGGQNARRLEGVPLTRRPPTPALPRRLQAALEHRWESVEDIPPRYLLAGIWAFLRASPRDLHQQARLVGAWNQGEKGLLPILRELEPTWMESELTSACPELRIRGMGDQRKRLIAHLVGRTFSTLWKAGGAYFGTRKFYATQVISPSENPKRPDEPLGWEAKDPSTISRGNAFAHALAFSGHGDPRLQTITTHGLPEALPDWLARQAQEAQDAHRLGQPFNTLEGCRIVCGFMNHGVLKFASLEEGRLRLGYDFCFLSQDAENSTQRLEFLAPATLQGVQLKAPQAQTLLGLFKEAGSAEIYSPK